MRPLVHFAHGLASMEEQAFLGYLVTQQIAMAALSGDDLTQQYTAFTTWWQASQQPPETLTTHRRR